MKVLLLDNYDSFTYNLADYLEQAGVQVEVHRNNEITVEQIVLANYDGWVISPGPDTPADSGMLLELLDAMPEEMPVLGICLGFQAIGMHFGARLDRGKLPVHGKVSTINFKSDLMYANIHSPALVCRYHSLELFDIPPVLNVNAYSEDGVVMSFVHELFPIWGVQYHPEAVLTSFGQQLMSNWVNYMSTRNVKKLELVHH